MIVLKLRGFHLGDLELWPVIFTTWKSDNNVPLSLTFISDIVYSEMFMVILTFDFLILKDPQV